LNVRYLCAARITRASSGLKPPRIARKRFRYRRSTSAWHAIAVKRRISAAHAACASRLGAASSRRASRRLALFWFSFWHFSSACGSAVQANIITQAGAGGDQLKKAAAKAVSACMNIDSSAGRVMRSVMVTDQRRIAQNNNGGGVVISVAEAFAQRAAAASRFRKWRNNIRVLYLSCASNE